MNKPKVEERVPYRIIITGSYRKAANKTAMSAIRDIEDTARNILVNMGLAEAGEDGIPEYNDVRIFIEDPRNTIIIKWNIDDVIGIAKDMKIKLSRKKAQEILAELNHRHDASIGINWSVIQELIEMRSW